MKNRDIIVTSLQSWDSEIGSNSFNIAREFARFNRVVYVNRAPERGTVVMNFFNRLRGKKGKPKGVKKEALYLAEPNLWVYTPSSVLESINPLPPFLYDFFARINARRFAGDIRKACQELGFRDPVLFVDNDFFRAYRLTDYLSVSLFIYYIRDFLLTQPYFRKHGTRVEAAAIRAAGQVVANSSYLAAYGEKFNKRSVDIGQGCDFTHFDPSRSYTPNSFYKQLNGPVIGYVGALVHYRLDVPLIESLAARRTDLNWVFVGPEDEVFSASSLHQLPHVYFVGRKEEKELASWVAGFDVCINPQLINEVTVGNYPRKVDEYLIMGKPVVATYTAFMQSFLPWVYLATGADEYTTALDKAIAEANVPELISGRKEFAASHTWEASVHKIYESINTKDDA